MKNQRQTGIILSYIQVFVNIIINLVYVPVLLHFLGKNEYGLYQIAGSLFSYVTVFESSMSVGVLRSYCKAMDSEDKQLMNSTLYNAGFIYKILALLIGAAGAVIICGFLKFYAGSMSVRQLQEGAVILSLLFLSGIITLLGSVYLTVLTAYEKFTFIKGLTLITTCLQPFLVILCIIRFPYAVCITIVMLLLNCISVSARCLYVKRKLGIKIRKCPRNKQITSNIIGLASAILVASIADQIFWKTDQIILGKLYGTAVVAVYSVGSQIYMLYMQLGTSFSQIYFPRINALYDNGKMNEISDLFIRSGRIIFFIILLVLTGFIVFGKDFLSLWVGNDYMQAYDVASLVMIPFSIDLAQNLGLSILQVTGRYGFRAKMYLLSALLNVISTVILSIFMGMKGAALSTGLSMFITSGIILNWYYEKYVGLKIKQYWQQCLPVIICSLVLMTAGYLFKINVLGQADTWFKLILQIGMYLIVYCISMYAFIMNDSEKELLKNLKGKVL